jgi:O-antigen/teichoic acid export membrane protein
MIRAAFTRVMAMRRYLRFLPFDEASEEGRTGERYRRAAWSFVSNIASQALGLAVMLLSVSLTAAYLGSERFGVWMTIASLSAVLAFLDLGLGNALINHIAQVAADGKPERLRRAVSGGLAAMACLAAAFAAVLALAVRIFPWEALFGSMSPAIRGEVQQSAEVFVLLFGINLFSTGIQKALAGLQMTYLVNFAASAGYLISAGLVIYLADRQADIPQLLLATFGVQAAMPLLLLPALLRRGAVGLDEVPQAMQSTLRSIAGQGRAFFLLQIGAIIASSADPAIIAHGAGASAVATLVVVQRLFQLISVPLQLANGVLWAGYADAHARGERSYIRNTLRRSLLATLLAAIPGCAIIVLLGPLFIARWTHGAIAADPLVIVLFGIWTILEVSGNALAVFMNATGLLRPQIAAVAVTTPLTLAVKIWAAQSFGLPGVIISTIVIFIATVAVFYLVLFRSDFVHVLRDADEKRPGYFAS